MIRPVLVDSSWYIQEARSRRDPLLELAFHAQSRDIAICGMVMAEVGRGIRIESVRKRYQRAWSEMLYVDSTVDMWNKTMALAWQMDRAGKILPIQDIHIAICATSIGAVVLTTDPHFKALPGVDSTDMLY